MPPPLIFDISKIDMDHVEMTIEQVRQCNPQRYEMEMLSGVIHLDIDARIVLAWKDVREDEFWVRGHIPGRPLLPGALMIEAAAQACSVYYKMATSDERFFGFGGVEGVKFRGQVVPGDRLVLLGKCTKLHHRRTTFEVQAIIGDKLVFEGRIIGMSV